MTYLADPTTRGHERGGEKSDDKSAKRNCPPQRNGQRKGDSVIVTEAIEGRGTEDDPVRNVLQYWSLDGKLLAKVDPVS